MIQDKLVDGVLIRRDELPDGTVLTAKHKHVVYTCTAQRSPMHGNRLVYFYGEPPRAYTSLSALGSELTGTQVNGWRFWSIAAEAEAAATAKAETRVATVAIVNASVAEGKAKKGKAQPKPASAPTKTGGGKRSPKGKSKRNNMHLMQDQTLLGEGEARYFCGACQFSSIYTDGQPAACTQGHDYVTGQVADGVDEIGTYVDTDFSTLDEVGERELDISFDAGDAEATAEREAALVS